MSKYNWEPMDTKNILKNVELVLKTGDSMKLSKKAYDCLYLMSGFIAHYDINGFRATYSDLRDLTADILSSMDTQDPDRYIRDTWFANEYGYAYCESKTNTYKGLRDLAKKYQNEITANFADKQKAEELATAANLAAKYGYKII